MSTNFFKNSSRFSSLLENDNILEHNNKKNKHHNKLPIIDSKKKNNLFKLDNTKTIYISRRNNLNMIQEKSKKTQEFNLYKETENFPIIESNNDNITTNYNNSQNFKDILFKQTNLKNDEIIEKKNYVKQGWVEIKADPNNLGIIEYNYGSKNQYLDYEDEMRDFYSNSKNFTILMNKTVEKMKIRWDKYKDDYNNEYGEGAYEDLYYSTPIYGSDYETESEISVEDNNYNEEYYDYND